MTDNPPTDDLIDVRYGESNQCDAARRHSGSVFSKGYTPLRGVLRVPGDKSISHRALMIGAVASGRTLIKGLLQGEDVLRTVEAMRSFGSRITPPSTPGGTWEVIGLGVGTLLEPETCLDLGNAGTAARLLIGLAASAPMVCFFTGDASLCRRPMARLITPLRHCGAEFISRSQDRLPLAVIGASEPIPIDYKLPIASAQVKSALLLAGLAIPGETRIIEPVLTRDHSERMLRSFGADLRIETLDSGERAIILSGQTQLTGQELSIPADPSSAAFPMVAALLCPDSELVLTEVGVNPRRIGLIAALQAMGADIVLEREYSYGDEPVADIRVRHSSLFGIDLPGDHAADMIDEYPILAIAAACAKGVSIFRGLGELRVKESDRLVAIADGLAACGSRIMIEEDSLIIHGTGHPPPGGGEDVTIMTRLDHRIAMSFLVLGMVTPQGVGVDSVAPIDTSFPGFVPQMNGIGARFQIKKREK